MLQFYYDTNYLISRQSYEEKSVKPIIEKSLYNSDEDIYIGTVTPDVSKY